ncbi:anti-sigma factor [Paenibacillus endoradicis]|uniref:anti-sigma factor n=1 Tax=Paenibacillus endoradicis TaxID=2972487 RepID=UPI0021592658|nr:anti-sigma factor [Paenibacillus endoradicis]MCR8657647.1 anti-sigma factor [Paenibacillus endoradicis]
MTEWNNKLEKKILFNSRLTLTLKIVRVLMIVFFIYCVWMIVISIIVYQFNFSKENQFYSQLAVEWQVPNVKGSEIITDEKLSMFGTQTFTYALLKRVGHEDIVIGEATVTKRLFSLFSNIKYAIPNQRGLSEWNFYLPEDPRNNGKLTANKDPEVWERLEMLPEGTVGELTFSSTSFMEPDQLIRLLEEYDVDILWMPLYTGEFVEYKPRGYSSGGRDLSLSNIIGLTGFRTVSDDFRTSSRTYVLSTESLASSEQAMLANMEKLLTKPKIYYEQLLGFDHLPERYKYLKDNGFTVYGAVVTGPVKELLKLQGATFIQGEKLGEVELWNWNLSK